MLETCYQYERIEAGCDEAGRGCLAGAVFAAAVILPPDFHDPLLNDSKQMSERNRDRLRPIIEREAVAWAVAAVPPERIDEINILNASFEGMCRAVGELRTRPEFLAIDGIRIRAERKGKRAAQLVAGRIGTGQNRREGFLVSAFNIVPKKGFSLEGVYTRFRNKGNRDGKWNEQEVASLEPGYYFTPTAFLGWEHLFAKGRDRRENVGSQYGYTLNFNLGDYSYTDPGSRRIRLHYYHQPQASVIVHTMNGWPGFFDTADQRLGMKGWGLSLDYVLARGVLLTLEGYDLKSIRRSPLLGDLRQRVLGGSITFGF